MRNRHIATVLAICLFSSLAIADNPTDAPLMTSDVNSAVDQQTGGQTRQHPHKKKQSRERQTQKEHASRKRVQPEQNNLNVQPSVTTEEEKE